MSHQNPTPLRIGATGTLHGWRVRVVGRVVLGVEIDGETYYWNEYNLVDDRGTEGTLVFEETDDGAEWKLFTAFEPAHPMTAAEAAGQRVGDRVNLDGRSLPITLVDESRVHHIEGTAPEGVQLGDVAHYFNADAGERMLVASWSGDEIEFYEGHDLREDEVAAAFGFSTQDAASSFQRSSETHASGAGASPTTKVFTFIVGTVLAIASVYGLYSCATEKNIRSARPAPRQAAPPVQLALGSKGRLGQEDYTITSRALVEIGRLGRRYQRREYRLIAGTGDEAMLVQGLNGGTKEWHLFTPIPAPGVYGAVPPYLAAALKRGAVIRMNDRSPAVQDVFFTKRLTTDGGAAVAETAWPPTQYGLMAQDAGEWLIARWTENAIQFHRGKPIAESEVIAAMKPGK